MTIRVKSYRNLRCTGTENDGRVIKNMNSYCYVSKHGKCLNAQFISIIAGLKHFLNIGMQFFTVAEPCAQQWVQRNELRTSLPQLKVIKMREIV